MANFHKGILLLGTLILCCGLSEASVKSENSVVTPKNPLDEIIRGIINLFKDIIVNGNECLGIPPLDPLNIESFPLDMTTPLFKMKGDISNILSTGLKELEATEVSSDLISLKLNMTMELPELIVLGNYDVDGLALNLFPVYGEGPFDINVGNVVMIGGGQLGLRLNGTVYLKNLDFQINVGNFSANFEGLLGGGELGELINTLVNELGLEVFNVVKAVLHDTLMDALLTFINAMLAGIGSPEHFKQDVLMLPFNNCTLN